MLLPCIVDAVPPSSLWAAVTAMWLWPHSLRSAATGAQPPAPAWSLLLVLELPGRLFLLGLPMEPITANQALVQMIIGLLMVCAHMHV